MVTCYVRHPEKNGLVFKSICLKSKKRPFFDKRKTREIYYDSNEDCHLRDRIEATRKSLINSLSRRIGPETKKAWVDKTIESLGQEQLNKLYDRSDQEFESSVKEEYFLARKTVVKQLKQVSRKIHQGRFLNIRAQYLCFLCAVPKLIDLSKWDISQEGWEAHTENAKNRFRNGKIKMANISPYLYLYDLIAGRRTDYKMRYAFIGETQDYMPFQLTYLRYNFPRTKFTMLGDLNQAASTKNESKTLLSQISKLSDPEKTDVVQLTKSCRLTKELTDFTKQILRQGRKIEAFDKRGLKSVFYKRDSFKKEFNALESILVENDEQRLTAAIITKTLVEAQEVVKVLKKREARAILIGSTSQRLTPGALIIPSYLAKGLKFDTVIAWNVSRDNYHQLDETQLLYTITSRTMYKLDLIYTGEKSPLLDDLNEKTCVNK